MTFESTVLPSAVEPVDGAQPELFYAYHVEYPPGGLSEDELTKLRRVVRELTEALPQSCQTLEFAFPGNMNPDTWKSAVQAQCYGWHWTPGLAYRLDKPPEAPKTPTRLKRYLASLTKAFPEQAQVFQQALQSSESPRPDPAHHLTKTPGFEKLFRNREWVSPTQALLGSGGFAMFCVEDTERFFREAAVATGQSDSMANQGTSFLIPLLTRDSLVDASREILRRWFSLFQLYLLEYRYAGGLLIASRRDISEIVEPLDPKPLE